MRHRARSPLRPLGLGLAGVGLAVLCLLATLGVGIAGEAESTLPPLDPHGKPDACSSCHRPGEGFEAVGAPKKSGQLCVPCHVTSDMHPSGVPIVNALLPLGWPVEDDRIVCTTCHAEPSCAADRGRSAPYLRGSPYEHEIEFCWRCHPATTYARTDPHHPDERRDRADKTCAFCHRGLPEDGAPIADSLLRAEPARLCALCHSGAVHTGTATHLGEVVDAARRGDLGPTLTVDAGGEVRCWTCHEVHGDTAAPVARDPATTSYPFSEMPGPDALWSEEPPPVIRPPKDPEHPPLLPLPSEGGELCRPCHGGGP